jgi:predicted RND superfamily exporter protein
MLSGDISQYANDGLEPTAIKNTIQLRTNSQDEDNRVVAMINDYAAANFPKTVRYFIGGGAMTEGAVTSLVVTSQIISVTVAVLMVFIIMALSNRSIAAGLISSVPLALTILCNFALMGFLGIKLNIATSLVASLGVGIGVDYTIHYIESYKREYRASGGKGDFLRRTFTSSGKAILINALSVGLSFGVLAFSRFKVMSEMGLLVAASMFINALVSLTVIPVLLTLINPKFVRQQKA